MNLKYFKITYLFLLIVGSCARVSDSDLARITESIPLDKSVELAMEQEFFEVGGWPTAQWWEMFEDPELNTLMELALKESPTIQKALAKMAEVEQLAKKTRAALFPKLDFDYEEQWEYFSKNGFVRSFYPTPPTVQVPATVNQLDLSLTFNYEIDFFGKNRNQFRAALGRARAERAETQLAILILTTHIAQTYIELQTKIAQSDVLVEQLNQRNTLFDLTTSRGKNGLDPSIPILKREQGVYEIEQRLIQLEKEITLDRHMLCALVGVGPDTDIHSSSKSIAYERRLSLPSDLSIDLLARRPDLTAQIWRVEAAAKEIGAAKADFYPRVNLMAFAELESLDFSDFLKLGSKQGGLVPSIHLPIFTGGKLTANLKEKVALFNEQTYHYNELLLTAAREVADQIIILSATFDILNFQSMTLETIQDQLTLQDLRFEHGVNNSLNVLEKEEELLTQRYLILGYHRDFQLAKIKMIKALGGGYHSHQTLPMQRSLQ